MVEDETSHGSPSACNALIGIVAYHRRPASRDHFALCNRTLGLQAHLLFHGLSRPCDSKKMRLRPSSSSPAGLHLLLAAQRNSSSPLSYVSERTLHLQAQRDSWEIEAFLRRGNSRGGSRSLNDYTIVATSLSCIEKPKLLHSFSYESAFFRPGDSLEGLEDFPAIVRLRSTVQ